MSRETRDFILMCVITTTFAIALYFVMIWTGVR